jgi:hypothetical protein
MGNKLGPVRNKHPLGLPTAAIGTKLRRSGRCVLFRRPQQRQGLDRLPMSEEVACDSAVPFAMTDFLLAFVRAQACPQKESVARA